jgi:mannose-6-phosphate isomerase-like protein (cupin superfamily)
MAQKRINNGTIGTSGRAAPRAVPVFSLYGETAAVDAAEFVHIEEIRARSARYDWHIKPHQHRGLYQILFVLAGAVEVQADGKTTNVPVPCALSVPPAVVHGFHFKPDTRGYILTVSEAMLPEARHPWRHHTPQPPQHMRAKSDQHDTNGALDRPGDGFGNGVSEQDGGAGKNEESDRVAEAPGQAMLDDVADAAAAGSDAGDGGDVIGLERMLHAQQQAETQNSEHACLTVIASEAAQSIEKRPDCVGAD